MAEQERKPRALNRALGVPDPRDEGPPGPILIPFLKELFTGSQRQTERTEAAPEIGRFSTGDVGQDFRIAAGLLTTLDPQAQANLFRDIPGVEVEEDERGNIFIISDGQEFVLNRPGFSAQDTVQATAQILAFLPSAKIQGVIGRMFAGAGTSIGLDVAAEQLGAEGALDVIDTSARGLVAAAAEGLTPPILRAPGAAARRVVGQRAAPAGTVSETAATVERGVAAERATGIDLLPSQRTGIPEELEVQQILAELPGGSQKALTALNRQNEQAGRAATEFLDLIAPPRAVETGQRRVRSAAQQSIENAKASRAEKVSPLFEQAFEEGLQLIDPSVRPIFPNVVSAGPFSAPVTPITTRAGKAFQETSTENLGELLLRNRDGGPLNSFVSDVPELALGQGRNKGVKITFKSEFLSGEESLAKPGLRIPGREGKEFQTNFISQNAIESIEIIGDTAIDRGLTRRLLRRDFDKRITAEGNAIFTPKSSVPSTLDIAIPLEQFPKGGEIHRSLTKVQNLIRNAGTDLRRLHNVKTEIDQMISKTGEGGLGPTTKRQLVQVQQELINTLENQSPAYAEARRVFREASPEVDAIKDSIIGKVAKVDDTQLKNISQRLLDPAEVNPQAVLNARKAIRTVDPEAWDEIVRVEIERRLGAAKVTQAAIQNEPGILVRAIFGNAKQRRVLLNALGPEQQSQAAFLETALRSAALGRPGGSQTASRQEILKRIGGAAAGLRRWFSSPIESLAGIGEAEAFRLKTAAYARLLFDPSFKGDLAAIKRLGAEEGAARMRKILEASLQVTTAATTVAARPIRVREEDGR